MAGSLWNAELSGKPPEIFQDDFTVSNNEDWFRDWTLKDSVGEIPLEAGWKLYMQLQNKRTGDLAMTNSSDNGRIIRVDAAVGKFGMRVRSADAAQIVASQYDYDIVLVAGDGIYRLVKGTVTVEQGITNVPGQEKWIHFPLILRP